MSDEITGEAYGKLLHSKGCDYTMAAFFSHHETAQEAWHHCDKPRWLIWPITFSVITGERREEKSAKLLDMLKLMLCHLSDSYCAKGAAELMLYLSEIQVPLGEEVGFNEAADKEKETAKLIRDIARSIETGNDSSALLGAIVFVENLAMIAMTTEYSESDICEIIRVFYPAIPELE